MTFRNRVLIQFAHPALHKSQVNRAMAAAARELPGVTFNDLYEKYPDFVINVRREQALLKEHDVVVFQHPFYWYSTPSILKEWTDLVLEYGFAYGEGGHSLQGKAWIQAMTTGGPESAYHPEGYNRFTVRQLLTPMDQTAHLCGMHFLAPFILHSALRLDPKKEVPGAVSEYIKLIEGLRDTDRTWDSLSLWESINPHLGEISKGRF